MSQLTVPLESSTRKKIDIILNNLGWTTDEDLIDCNVFTEIEKHRSNRKNYWEINQTIPSTNLELTRL